MARRHGIVTSLLFRWRARLGFGKGSDAKLATVTLADGQAVAHSTAHSATHSAAFAPALVLHDLLPVPEGMKVVELDDGRKVFAPSNMDEAVIRLHVFDREAMR